MGVIDGLIDKLNVQAVIDKIIEWFFIIVKLPIELWNAVPDWIKYILYSIIFLIAVFITWLTIKYKDEWRSRV